MIVSHTLENSKSERRAPYSTPARFKALLDRT